MWLINIPEKKKENYTDTIIKKIMTENLSKPMKEINLKFFFYSRKKNFIRRKSTLSDMKVGLSKISVVQKGPKELRSPGNSKYLSSLGICRLEIWM